MVNALLDARGLATEVYVSGRWQRAVDGFSIAVGEAESVGIVGESGAGKSLAARSLCRLLPHNARIADGTIQFGGVDIANMSERTLRRSVRRRGIAWVSQNPMTSLNPLLTIGDQLVRVIRLHDGVASKDAARRAGELLESVEIPHSTTRMREYPHEFSGGMLQRVCLALALACRPRLLVADEPTTALDVTTQAQILRLLGKFRDEEQLAVLMISHNLAVIRTLCDRVTVMYAGRVIEEGPTQDLIDTPLHPYTRALIATAPTRGTRGEKLPTIPGSVPRLGKHPSGCRFHPRCPHVFDRCPVDDPVLRQLTAARTMACHLELDVPEESPSGSAQRAGIGGRP